MNNHRRIRVLIVDDSAVVRKILTETLTPEPDIEVVGTAPDPYVARDKILALHPDVLTLDIEMPRMDGLTFLRKLMRFHPLPVIVISGLGHSGGKTTIEALLLGAVEVLAKPGGSHSVAELAGSLPQKVRAAAAARVRRTTAGAKPLTAAATPSYTGDPVEVIAIGASTGGTEAIQQVLTQLPADCPPILITQHIPAGFSRAFANRLNELCVMEVREAADGDELRDGLALVAPGNLHMLMHRTHRSRCVILKDGPRVCFQRPSADVLFRSVVEVSGPKALGVLLTGMGVDGAQGLLEMKLAGAATIVQDGASCAVFGMPKEAIRLGAAGRILPLSRIAAGILAGNFAGKA